MKTKEKLALALKDAGAPSAMISRASAGYYDDFESELTLPMNQLITDAVAHGLHDIVARAMNGEFDGTKEEAEAWFQREGRKFV